MAMSDHPRALERNGEIVTFFYTIFGVKVHEGMSPENARKEAYDAVTLRYGIGRGRLLNIISNQKSSRKVNNSAFRQNAIALMDVLKNVNSGLDKMMGENAQLISLLQKCIDDNR